MIRVTIEDPEIAKQVANGGDPLRSLCQKECDSFERLMQQQEPNFGTLARFERMAIVSYLYQKLRGRLDSAESSDQLLGA